ncbi:MAG TPA: RNA polymerase sigma factor [Vicinamibacterales bacterium]
MTTIARALMNTLDRRSPADVSVTDPSGDTLRLFREHGGAIYRFCRSSLRSTSDAEDVVQETFLKLLQHLKANGDRSNLRSWLFTVAANACRDRARGRARWLPWSADSDRRTVAVDDERDDVRRAQAALRALGARDRMLLSLRANGLSYREIAVASGIRETSVGRLLARAVDRWKRNL